MDAVLNAVKQQLTPWPQWQEADHIVLGLSGGVDSMVLLHCLEALIQMKDVTDKKITVAHFNHRIRQESDWEADQIRQLCQDRALAYVIGQWDQPAEKNLEAAARQARYRFFADIVQANEGDILMTGHHLNDLAETLIMRQIRGSSLKGLGGIRPNGLYYLQGTTGETVPVRIMRPLIQVKKVDLYTYAHKHQLAYYEDATNKAMDSLRNRIRHQILPRILEENPSYLEAAYSTACKLQSSYLAHYQAYMDIEPKLQRRWEEGWLFFVDQWQVLTRAQRLTYIEVFLEERWSDLGLDYSRQLIHQLNHLLESDHNPNMTLDLPDNYQAIKEYDTLWLGPQAAAQSDLVQDQPVSLDQVNTWYSLTQNERGGVFDREAFMSMSQKYSQRMIPLALGDFTGGHFSLRHRQAGDAMALSGPDGVFHKKISRIMIDDKVPQSERQQHWLLVDSQDQVLAYFPHYVAVHPLITGLKEASHIFLYQKKSDESDELW